MISTAYLRALVLIGLVSLAYQEEVSPVVKTLLGDVRGRYKLSYKNRRYEAYEGIPYAQPPLGTLRFKPPVPALPWEGVLPATKHNAGCMQYVHIISEGEDRVSGSEDCLYLHIYTQDRDSPVRSDGNLLPVFFYIHGGAFQFGNGNEGPKFVMDRDVIVVSIQYRLGIFGFLSTGDDVVPGNMGLKDQSMALRWVSENIQFFGGDPKKITLLGLSAGGASVHYHYLSPLSTGLFRNGISMSGTAFDCWAFTENAAEKAKKLGSIMGCPTEDNGRMVSCLQTRSPYVLSQVVREFMFFLYNPFTPFGPVVEKGGDAPFIDRSPAEIISSGAAQDLPWITGVVSEEGLYPAAEFANSDEMLKQLDEKWDEIAPHYLDFNYTIPQKDHVKVARLIRKHYLQKKKISKATFSSVIKMTSDRLFIVDSYAAAKMHALAKEPVWYYYYTYRANQSLSDAMSRTNNNYGVSHGDDFLLMFENHYVNPTVRKSDMAMQKKLLDIFVSFATDGVPQVKGSNWTAVNANATTHSYLQIDGPRNIYMKSQFNLGNKKFWDLIDFDENKVSNDTRSVA